MNRRKSLAAAAAAAAAAVAGLFPVRRAAAAEKQHRVVFDLSAEGPERWDGALRNVENVRRAFGPEAVEVHLVVHGKAYPLLQKSSTELEARLRELHAGGVRFSLCRNTMKRFSVPAESLFPFADTVDAAVAELVRKQEAGWAYIKTGG